MGLPIGAGQPLVLRLAGGQIIVDLDLIETGAAGHGILIGQHMPVGAQAALVAAQAQDAGDGKAAPIRERGEIDTLSSQ
jgi:hypothetical protein